jgi:hypothetical protein
MFNDNPLEKLGRNPRIPYSFGIHDNDRSACADAEAWSLAALHPASTEQQSLSLKQLGEK